MIDIMDLPRAVHSSMNDSFPTFLIVTAGGWNRTIHVAVDVVVGRKEGLDTSFVRGRC